MTMSTKQTPALRVAEGSRISAGVAVAAWSLAWAAGIVISALVVGATGESGDDLAVWVTVLGTVVMWTPMVLVLREVSIRYGTREFFADYGLRFTRMDLLGLPIGALSQLVLLRIVYWPLQGIWPDTFSSPKLEEKAQTLYDSAHGGWMVALVLMVVIGAPLVEEVLYRGLLQGAFVRRFQDAIAVVIVAAWFAIIHFVPVEYPGLFAFGLVLGACALFTRRLGLSIVTHVAFNATGLIWVATR